MATAVSIKQTSDAEEIAALIARSRAAQAQIANYTQAQVDALIRMLDMEEFCDESLRQKVLALFRPPE